MSNPQIAPYGSWRSPITTELITAESIGLGQVMLDGDDVYWLELRPQEAGRAVIVRRAPDGTIRDVLPSPFNARTRVHEYGGGAYLVHEGIVYFSNFADQRLYRLRPGVEPEPLTPESERALRYADGVMDRQHQRILCVREDHRDGARAAVNTLVALSLAGDDEGQVLVSGNDFYAAPRLSPDGQRLAWLTWNHPHMPWSATELWVAEIGADGTLENPQRVAGGQGEGVVQPEWSPDGTLYFVSDRSGWSNLYRWRAGTVEPLHAMEADTGPIPWTFRGSTYAFADAQRLVFAYVRRGQWALASLDIERGTVAEIPTPYGAFWSLQAWRRDISRRHAQLFFVAGSPTEPPAVVQLDLESGQSTTLRRSMSVQVDPGYLSVPQPIEFPTENGLTAHGLFYPPTNRSFVAPPGERPPLLVMSHGGPTSAATSTLNLEIQYWTSRGIAVLDVNYGGSTGYGRAYRERLDGQWGIVDRDDCVNGARYLVEQGLVDGERLAITGGSAGGYTTLCALTFCDLFKAGASHFGVSDLAALAEDTHKFESRYLDTLIAPYPARRDLYEARSPIHFTEQLSCPMIFFQGLEDKVVPPAQSERMVDALRAKGVPVAYLAFEGEQHGFRRAATIQRVLEAELYFYGKILGFEPADEIEPVPIENL